MTLVETEGTICGKYLPETVNSMKPETMSQSFLNKSHYFAA